MRVHKTVDQRADLTVALMVDKMVENLAVMMVH